MTQWAEWKEIMSWIFNQQIFFSCRQYVGNISRELKGSFAIQLRNEQLHWLKSQRDVHAGKR